MSAGAMAAPLLSVPLKLPTGEPSATAPSTLTISNFTPLTVLEVVGMTCEPVTEASNSSPSGTWQAAHFVSSFLPPPWFSPVPRLTSSWQAVQAAVFGAVLKLSLCAPPLWHGGQLGRSGAPPPLA